jgi:signal transduction histidine kinase
MQTRGKTGKMITPTIPENEKDRLSALYQYQILDTLPQEDMDNITRLASEICQTPVSLISLIDNNRQWFKSHHGTDATETSREIAFCAHAINYPDSTFIIPDSRKDERFADNPLVTGAPNIVFYAGVPLIDPNGFALGTLCIIDQKPRNLMENQIDALKILGAQTIRLFELHKANIELEINKGLLLKRNNDLERFAAVVSHDLKSPLASITSFIHLLKLDYSGHFDDKGKKIIDYIDGSAKKLRSLIDGILAYYRSDTLLLDATESYQLNDFINSVIKMLQFPPSTIFKLPNNEEVFINKSALTQIFLNLISNSIRYNNKTLPVIEITFEADEYFYYFTVSDNGLGIAPEKIDKVFDLFMTINKKDINGVESIGIGLPTVKKLVENMGGEISVESTVDRYTRFRFSIKKR